MAQQEILADPDSWEGRSHDQLQQIMNRGLAGGDDFVRAAREMERRSRQFFEAEELAQAEAARNAHRRHIVIWLAIGLMWGVAMTTWMILG